MIASSPHCLVASPHGLTVKRNMHGKRRVVPRCVPRLEDLRTDDRAQSVGDEHECEDCDFLGLAGCRALGVSVELRALVSMCEVGLC